MWKGINKDNLLIVCVIVSVMAIISNVLMQLKVSRLESEQVENVKLLEEKNIRLEERNQVSRQFQDALMDKVNDIAEQKDSVEYKLIKIKEDHEDKVTYLLNATDSEHVAFFAAEVSKMEQRDRNSRDNY